MNTFKHFLTTLNLLLAINGIQAATQLDLAKMTREQRILDLAKMTREQRILDLAKMTKEQRIAVLREQDKAKQQAAEDAIIAFAKKQRENSAQKSTITAIIPAPKAPQLPSSSKTQKIFLYHLHHLLLVRHQAGIINE